MIERFSVIGVGQCGGNIAELFGKNGLTVGAFNTTWLDVDNLDIEHKYVIGNTEGSGGDFNLSKQTFSTNLDKVREGVKKITKGKEVVLIPFATGGGTGRGAYKHIYDICKELGKSVWLIPVNPYSHENGKPQVNSITWIIKEFEQNKNEMIAFPFTNTLSKENMNKYIVDCFMDVLKSESVEGETVFDYQDLLKTIKNGYNLIIKSNTEEYKLTSSSLDVTTSKYCVILNNKSKVDIKKLADDNQGILGRKIYRVKNVDLWTGIFSGLSINKEKLQLELEEAKKIVELSKKKEAAIDLSCGDLEM